jgi:MFS family permease
MEAYRRVLATPGFRVLALASLLARMPTGMAAISFVLYLQHETGSFAAAGAGAAAFTVGFGLTAPLLGRLVDSRGRGILVPAAAVSALAMAAVVVLGRAGAATAFLVAAAGIAGLAAPPLGGVFRHRLSEIADPAEISTAFALDSILIEVLFVTGPLLAGGLAATVGPGAAVLAAAVAGLTGTVWFAALLPPHRPDPAARAGRPRLGALASPTIRLVVLGGVPIGATFGALDVALPAFGVAHGSAALGGPFGAALAFGSGIGGIAYGLRPRALGGLRTAYLVLTALQLLLALPLLIGPPVPLMFVFAIFAGLCVAPLISVRSEVVRADVPAGTGTEAFTWTTVSITVGAAAGSALAGPLVEAGGWRAGVVAACCFPLVGFVAAVSRRHLL